MRKGFCGRKHGHCYRVYRRFGKEYDVQIIETSRKGDGIARIQGFVIFVKNGRTGQNAKVKITQIGERFATADIV